MLTLQGTFVALPQMALGAGVVTHVILVGVTRVVLHQEMVVSLSAVLVNTRTAELLYTSKPAGMGKT